jgi:prepilin-type N-terminal cleavage/methylation domain-containing protein
VQGSFSIREGQTERNRVMQKSLNSRGFGFTLIEMIGVLAVLAILATIILSATPRQLDIVASNLESTNLVNYAAAFQGSVLRNRVVPNSNSVAQAIATELGIDVQDVLVNARNNSRAFIYDPQFQFNTNINLTTVYGWQGWTQNLGGAFIWGGQGPNAQGSNNPPYRPRLMIVSNVGPSRPPLPVTNSLSDGDFTTLWGWPADSLPNSGPWATFLSSGGRADDVKVQRIDLSPLFMHLVLYNYNAPSTNQGQYNIDPDRLGLAVAAVPNWYTNGSFVQSGVDSYFLRGTVLGLYKSVRSGSTLDANQILNRHTSFDYVQEVWRSSINLGEGVDKLAAAAGNAMWATTQLFQQSPYSTTAKNGVTPAIVVNDVVSFMSNYVLWSQTVVFPGTNDPTYVATRTSQAAMIDDMTSLCGLLPRVNSDTPAVSFTAGACTNPPAQ